MINRQSTVASRPLTLDVNATSAAQAVQRLKDDLKISGDVSLPRLPHVTSGSFNLSPAAVHPLQEHA